MTTTPHAYRRNLITVSLFLSIVLLAFLFSSCKKQVEATEKINVSETYFKIIEVDLDGKEWPSLVFHAKTDLQMEGNGKHYTQPEPDWKHWADSYRIWWCNQLADAYDYFPLWYCKACKESALCAVTPVLYKYAKIDGSVIKWGIATSASVSFYRIDFSKDGLNFKTLVTNIPDHGIGDYSFTIK